MLNAKFLNKPWREHARRKSASENRAELLIQTTDAHILKLEIWGQNRIRRGLPRARLDLNFRNWVLQERYLCLFHHDPTVGPGAAMGAPAGYASAALLHGKFEDTDALDDTPEILAVILKHEDLPNGKNDATEPADKRRGHFICRELLCNLEVPLQEADFERECLEERGGGWMWGRGERRHSHCVATGG